MLVQFAQLGVAYAQVALGIAEPRVGLLSIGAEPGKGNKLARRAHELLEADPPHGGLPISFTGNVEGGDLLAGKVDVVVTDGFTGNVALKTLEGTAAFAGRQLREAIGGSRTARLGALLQRRGLRELSERLDAETYGGAALLGLEATVVIAHGAVAARGAAVAVRLTADLASAGITDKIRERLAGAAAPISSAVPDARSIRPADLRPGVHGLHPGGNQCRGTGGADGTQSEGWRPDGRSVSLAGQMCG